jgi:CheY-like chemotaxis protein
MAQWKFSGDVNNFYQTCLPAAVNQCFLSLALDMSQNESNGGGNSSPLIFVVDDESMLLDLAAAILQPLGFKVRTFTDPQSALTEFPAAKPAVVVTDYAMGAMNGMDLVRECRRVNPRQKIMLVSGTVDESIYAGSATKPDSFLAKPYQVRDFVESVQKLAAI